MREVAFGCLEEARQSQLIGSALAAHVKVYVADDDLRRGLQTLNNSSNGVDELRYLFVTSQVRLIRPGKAVFALGWLACL